MFKLEKKFLKWKEYKNKIDFLELFYWQQAIRRVNAGENL